MSDLLLGGLIGILIGLVLAETVLIVQLCRFLKSRDVSLFSDDWYPVRIRKFPFTTVPPKSDRPNPATG